MNITHSDETALAVYTPQQSCEEYFYAAKAVQQASLFVDPQPLNQFMWIGFDPKTYCCSAPETLRIACCVGCHSAMCSFCESGRGTEQPVRGYCGRCVRAGMLQSLNFGGRGVQLPGLVFSR